MTVLEKPLTVNGLSDKDDNFLSRIHSWFRRPVFALLGLFSPLLVLRALLLLGQRLPMGHDTFQYLQLQYSFFNEAALNGTLPPVVALHYTRCPEQFLDHDFPRITGVFMPKH